MIFNFYSPSHFEKWDYRNPLGAGIGGSETAHIEMALRLAKRGHKVFSYSPLPKDITSGKKYKGVWWFDLKDADFKEPGIWVIYRSPKTFYNFKNKTKYQKVWLVMQDTEYPDLNEQNEMFCDKYLALCTKHVQWTKNKHPKIADRVILSANGIRTDIIKSLKKVKRDPHRMMFASSPDRGLANLLKIFPRIKQQVPDATLHIFYGFDNIEKVTEPDDPIDPIGTTVREFKTLMDQDGIFWHGRVGQLELYQEWLKTGIWPYTTQFSETSCITSMEAQALGVIPITNPFWALVDNVMSGSLIDGDPGTDGLTRLRYVDEIVYWMTFGEQKGLQATQIIGDLRKDMMKESRNRFDWEKVVDQYESLAKS